MAQLQQLPANQRPPTEDDQEGLCVWLDHHADAMQRQLAAPPTRSASRANPRRGAPAESPQQPADANDADAAASGSQATLCALRDRSDEAVHPYTRLQLALPVQEHALLLPPPPAAAVEEGARAGAATPLPADPLEAEEDDATPAGRGRAAANHSSLPGKRTNALRAPGARPATPAATAALHPLAVAVNELIADGMCCFPGLHVGHTSIPGDVVRWAGWA